MIFRLKENQVKGEKGLTYIEVVLAVLLLSLALVPALNAIRGSIAASRGQQELISGSYAVLSKMEYVLAQSYSNLADAAAAAGSPTNPTTYSDPGGTPARALVFLALYDADNADGDSNPLTGGDAGLLWVRVALADGSSAMESLASQY